MRHARIPIALFGLLALAACAVIPRSADPQIAILADTLQTDAGTFYAQLAAKQAPECVFQANAGSYDRLTMQAEQLKSHIKASHGSLALTRAAEALAGAIVDVRASHELASAHIDDANGACMAPGAITLNANAIAHASQSVANTRKSEGGQ